VCVWRSGAGKRAGRSEALEILVLAGGPSFRAVSERVGFDSLFLTSFGPTRHVSGHDLSVLHEMSVANRGLRSRAAKIGSEDSPCAAGPARNGVERALKKDSVMQQ
jgi:hypothetical protein